MLTLPSITHGVEIRPRSSNPVEFVCPRCGVDRPGSVIVPQRWYCAVGVRLMPLAVLEPVVECGSCGHHAGVAVLEVLTSSQLARCLEEATSRSIAHVIAAGGDPTRIDLDVVAEATQVMESEGFHYDEQMLARDVLAADPTALAAALRPLVDELTPHGKQGFLHRLIGIALADGALTRREVAALVEVGVALGMAAPHINGVLATATTDVFAGVTRRRDGY